MSKCQDLSSCVMCMTCAMRIFFYRWGFFYDNGSEKDRPGHFRTLLDMIQNINTLIVPDGTYDRIIHYPEIWCFTVCKGDADRELDRQLATYNPTSKGNNPVLNIICQHKTKGGIYGLSFNTWGLLKKCKVTLILN